MGFKQHEKFWAFVVLILTILGLAITATLIGGEVSRIDTVNEAQQAILTARLRILELIAVGLIGIAGAAGQSLFRTSENAGAMNDILKSTIEGLKRSAPVAPKKPADVTIEVNESKEGQDDDTP